MTLYQVKPGYYAGNSHRHYRQGTKMKIRDSKTGRFAKVSTYKRSRAAGGTRYKQVRSKPTAHGLGLRKTSKYKPAPVPIAPSLTPPVVETITRRQYKGKGGKVTHIEIRSIGDKIKSVRIGKREYTNPKDIAALGALLKAAS